MLKPLVACAVVAMLQTGVGGKLTYKAPDGWKERPPASSMRVAEFVIPHASGDAEDAEVVIYYFGSGGGGSPEANIQRWIGQIRQPDGSPSAAVAKHQKLTVNGLSVEAVDIAGTYVAEMRPGASEHYNKPGFRLEAAVVETPRGPYYIKLTGPQKTVASAQDDYDTFLASLKYGGG
jgi:hypothetical protein